MNPLFVGCWRTLALALTAGVCNAGAGAAELSAVTQQVQGWVERGYYPGVSVLIAQHDELIYARSFGAHTEDTPVLIASAGKWLAAAALMTLVDDGTLTLDDRADRWVPELKGDPKGAATLRQMLSHTSGYPPYQPADRPVDKYQTLGESVAHLADLPPVFRPGERFDYGGLAMQVAGRMAEIATGKDWETLFQERIARPLRMTQTHFTPVDSGGGHSPMLGGGARSTARDYLNFLSMIAHDGAFEGRRILSVAAIETMQADHVRDAQVRPGEFVERVRGATHRGIYGLGEWREELDAAGRATLLSSPSWAGAYPWIDRTCGVYGVVMAHVAGPAVARDRFSGFYASPAVAPLVRAAIARSDKTHRSAAAPTYQFRVPVGQRGTAFLWVPPRSGRVRGLIFSMENLLERNWLEDPHVREAAAAQDLAIVYLTGRDPSLTWEMKAESVATFAAMCRALAADSGYEEIAEAPVIWIGHSFHGRTWLFANALPARTLAVLPIRTYPMPATLGFSGIPLCYLVGQTTELPQFDDGRPGDRDFFWPVVRQTTLALRAADENQLIGAVVYPGGTHTDWSESQARFIALFIRKACERRLPATAGEALRPIGKESGWLTDAGLLEPDAFSPAPYNEYRGDPKKAYWFFDEEMARAAVALNGDRRARARQMVTLLQDGRPLPVVPGLAGARLRFAPEADGRTFTVTGGFLAAVPEGLVNAGAPLGHATEGDFRFQAVRGPIVQVGPDRFRVQFNGPGSRASAQDSRGALLNVEHPGDAQFRRAIQPMLVEFPSRLTVGQPQRITFPPVGNVKVGSEEVVLAATVDSGLAAEYYVVAGPAVVEGSRLRFGEIPPRARFPIKVTVAAYQWGRTLEPRYQSADVVEQNFLIER